MYLYSKTFFEYTQCNRRLVAFNQQGAVIVFLQYQRVSMAGQKKTVYQQERRNLPVHIVYTVDINLTAGERIRTGVCANVNIVIINVSQQCFPLNDNPIFVIQITRSTE